MPEVDVEILHETQSLCPVCLRRLDARYVRRGQSILLERTCPEHGTFAVDIWHERTEEDVTPPRFDGWSRPKTPSYPREPRTAVRHGCPYDCGLCPAHAQHTCTGLVEVTLRCNMACPICYAAAGGAVPLLRYRTGDMASLLDGPCACGSPLPRLGPVLGRIEYAGQGFRVTHPRKGGSEERRSCTITL